MSAPKTYPLFKAHILVDEALEQIRVALASGFINEGVQVSELTQALRRALGAERLVLTNSCTSALTLALRLAGAGMTSDVIATPITCVASNTPIANAGARIVWADVDPSTGMLDPADVEKKITPDTKAVVAVAWAGTPPELDALQEVCGRRGVKLILDAAHAFGAEYQGRPIHEFADHTCYSFQAIKHFTTGDGGAIVCRSEGDHKRAKALKWFGLDRDAVKDAQGNWKGQQWDADIIEVGWKANMNNVAAAIGLSQIPHISRILWTHRANAELYDELFEGNEEVRPATRSGGGRSSAWVYTMLLANASPWGEGLQTEVLAPMAHRRDELLRQLNEEGIMAGIVHVPNDAYTAFSDSWRDLPGVRQFSATQFSLPCGWWMTEGDVRHVAKRVKELVKGAGK